MKRNEALTLATTWMDPKNMMLSDRRRQTDTQGVIPLMGNIQNRPIHRHRQWVPGCQGLGSEEWRVTANIVRVSLGGDGMFWVKTVVMVTQHSEYMKTTTVHFKRVSFLVCKLCLKEYCSPLPSLHS